MTQHPDRPKRRRASSWDGILPRRRATLILRRCGRVLLLRDIGRDFYALPGGGIDGDEPPIVAAARELYEETGLEATSIKYLFNHLGKYNDHHLYEAEAQGDITVQEDEIESFTWWDRRDDTPVAPHVREILERLTQSAMATEATKMQGDGQ